MTREEAINEIKSWDFLEGKEIEAIQTLVPELAESEDERIIKTIRQLLETARDAHSNTSLAKPFVDALAWLEKQKEQKHILKFKVGDKVHLEGDDVNILTITGIEKDRYLTDNSYGPILFGAEDIWQIVEQKPAECERQPEFKEVEYDFRGEKVKVMRPFFRDDKGREFSTTGQDTDLTWSVLREWCEIKGIIPYDLYPRAEWSEEDEKKLERVDDLLWMLDDYISDDCSICEEKTARLRDEIHNELFPWLEFLRPQYHGDVTMTEAYKMGLEAGKASSWKPNEKQTNNVIVELTRIELGDIINGLYYLKEKYYEDCKEHNGTATIGLSDEFKFYFKRFNEVLDLYTRLHELEKERYGTTTYGYYYE